MSVSEAPVVRELDREECLGILARNTVGRLAFVREGRVDVQPIHYVARGDWLYGRTSYGEKLEALEHEWWVAFEVDEMEGMFDWRSVVVHGGFYPLPAEGSADDLARRARAIEALRALLPETLRETDPAPYRTVVFGVAVQGLSGRECRTVTEGPPGDGRREW